MDCIGPRTACLPHVHYTGIMKTTTIQIRLQPQEKEAFKEAAYLAGMALSAWMRARLRKAAIRELEDASHTIPFIDTGAPLVAKRAFALPGKLTK